MTETRTIRGENGRTIECELVHQVEIDGQSIGVMNPVDCPAALYFNGTDGAPDRRVEDWWNYPDEVKTLADRLKDDGIELILSGVTLTVRGDDPEMDDADPCEPDEGGEDPSEAGDDSELHAVLAEVDGRYGLCIPLCPCLFLAILDDQGGVAVDVGANRELRAQFAAAVMEPTE